MKTLTQLRKLATKKGYDFKTIAKRESGTKIENEYIFKNGICISVLKISGRLSNISIYEEWGEQYEDAGKILYYGATVDNAIDFINGVYEPRLEFEPMPYDEEDRLPF